MKINNILALVFGIFSVTALNAQQTVLPVPQSRPFTATQAPATRFYDVRIINNASTPITADIVVSHKDTIGSFGLYVAAHSSAIFQYPEKFYWFEQEGRGFGTGTSAALNVLKQAVADQVVIHDPNKTEPISHQLTHEGSSTNITYDGTSVTQQQHNVKVLSKPNEQPQTNPLQTIRRGGTPTPRAGIPIMRSPSQYPAAIAQ